MAAANVVAACDRLRDADTMRRADRLFQIIQILRRSLRRPITAEAIARELETSRRTVYRDIADLIGQRVPIRGEAGTGYVLDGGYDMPPLMLTPDEIEAAVLGAQWVAGRADPVLARAADDLIAKIAATVPERLRPYVMEPASRVPPSWDAPADRLDLAKARAQIHAGRKITLDYRDEQDRPSRRTVWPVAIGYFQTVQILAAWCELRRDFRAFRTDRVERVEFLDERDPERPAVLRAKWRRQLALQRRAEMAGKGAAS
jgi:predicted DNA-binding transcriptional regulator YafY